MNVFLLGVERRSGKAKATGRDFDFVQIHAAMPVENMDTGSFRLNGFGLKPVQLRADVGIEKLFEKLTLPGRFTLVMDYKLGMSGEVEAVVVGLEPSK